MSLIRYEDCTAEEKAEFDKVVADAEAKERKWFTDREYGPSDIEEANAAFQKYIKVEESRADRKPFDKAPGFRRMFMMGYFYGVNT